LRVAGESAATLPVAPAGALALLRCPPPAAVLAGPGRGWLPLPRLLPQPAPSTARQHAAASPAMIRSRVIRSLCCRAVIAIRRSRYSLPSIAVTAEVPHTLAGWLPVILQMAAVM
jgi:hypothetical protein